MPQDHVTPPRPNVARDTRHVDHVAANRGDGGSLLAEAVSSNAVFSALSGLVLAVAAFGLDGWLGVDAWLLAGIGVGLLGFAGALAWLLVEPRRLALEARWVIAADAAWVGGSTLLLVGFPSAMSGTGRVTLAMVSAVVAIIVVGQFAGLRRHRSGPMTATSPIELSVERIINAPADQVWNAVADAGDYARFAPGIAAATIVAGDGGGMVRVCTDDHGGQWRETCTLWEGGHRYRMTVDVASYPPYYRSLLHEFAQTWTVEPAAKGTRVQLLFTGSVKLGTIGRLAARVLGNRRRLETILDGYERELAAHDR